MFALAGATSATTLAAATLVSEDLTCIAAGLLIRAGQVAWPAAIIGCTLGIFLGDLGLWGIGRVFGRRALAWPWIKRRLPADRVSRLSAWFDDRGWKIILASRFAPGTRLPVYVAAGIVGRRADRFVLWSFAAALLWTPLVVLLVAGVGESLAAPLAGALGIGWPSRLAAALIILALLRLALLLGTPAGRDRLSLRLARVRNWEFWPAWLFYAPLLPWIAWLTVRHRGLTTLTAANPDFPHGGVVGESKIAILEKLPAEWIVPSALIPAAEPDDRIERLRAIIRDRRWSFPIIMKPDAGQRGVGVKLIADEAAAVCYLTDAPEPILAQCFHPGPHEAGIFYVRRPTEARGRIFSITDKQFPAIVGDGVSSVESIIRSHPRYRLQAKTFLTRMNGRAATVLAPGERLPLAIAGNHCQGTMFRDGRHLRTTALEESIDRIVRGIPGFYFGRLDVRYADPAELARGAGFAIVELNGALSESTNIYDPSGSLLGAYAVLFRQWSLLFEIGAANRRRGVRPSRFADVIRDAAVYYRTRRVSLVSD